MSGLEISLYWSEIPPFHELRKVVCANFEQKVWFIFI